MAKFAAKAVLRLGVTDAGDATPVSVDCGLDDNDQSDTSVYTGTLSDFVVDDSGSGSDNDRNPALFRLAETRQHARPPVKQGSLRRYGHGDGVRARTLPCFCASCAQEQPAVRVLLHTAKNKPSKKARRRAREANANAGPAVPVRVFQNRSGSNAAPVSCRDNVHTEHFAVNQEAVFNWVNSPPSGFVEAEAHWQQARSLVSPMYHGHTPRIEEKWRNDRKQKLGHTATFGGHMRDAFRQRVAAQALVALARAAEKRETMAICRAHLLAWCAVPRDHTWEKHMSEDTSCRRFWNVVPYPRLTNAERHAMSAFAFNVRKRSEQETIVRDVRNAMRIVCNVRELESVCLQSFCSLQVSGGAAVAAHDGVKRVEISVLNVFRPHRNKQKRAGKQALSSQEESDESTCADAEDGQAVSSSNVDRCGWDKRMWTITRHEACRVIGTHSTECVWLLERPRRGRGFRTMLRILSMSRGLHGLYSPEWLSDNHWRVSFLAVLELVGTPGRPCDAKDAKWAPCNFARVFTTASLGRQPAVEDSGKPAAGLGGWLRQCTRTLQQCTNKCTEAECYAVGRRGDPLQDFEFGFSRVRSVLYPWPCNAHGFDSFLSAARYVESVWGLAQWDLADDTAHLRRLQPLRVETPCAGHKKGVLKMADRAWSVVSRTLPQGTPKSSGVLGKAVKPKRGRQQHGKRPQRTEEQHVRVGKRPRGLGSGLRRQ